ncbi:MAG: PhzF family phenazine biosynthesis protein, partial [Enterobacteriaceae bacterium]
MVKKRRFKQVDVFTQIPCKGNPLAVVMDAQGLCDADMQAIANWTNLSETTFVLPATEPTADYQLRIFTPADEMPFAGHPTLGSAHALLESGLQPKTPGRLVQQCGVGLVPITINPDHSLAFKAPPVNITTLEAPFYSLLPAVLGHPALPISSPLPIVDIGNPWLLLPVPDSAQCLALQVDGQAFNQLEQQSGLKKIMVYAPNHSEPDIDYDVRAFCLWNGVLVEDPVTGSANACLARLLLQRNQTCDYQVRQGVCRDRDGRLSVRFIEGEPWIGGHSLTLI